MLSMKSPSTWRFAAVAAAAIVLTSGTPAPAAAESTAESIVGFTAGSRAESRAGSVNSQVSQVIALTNAVRARAGCGRVVLDSDLAQAARAHSVDMARRGYFSHYTPNGGNPGRRIASAGYRWSTYGENIAWGQPNANTVMRDWMNSPGHRANILNCRYRNIGVGIAYNARGVPYWTQEFARGR